MSDDKIIDIKSNKTLEEQCDELNRRIRNMNVQLEQFNVFIKEVIARLKGPSAS